MADLKPQFCWEHLLNSQDNVVKEWELLLGLRGVRHPHIREQLWGQIYSHRGAVLRV